MLQVLFPYQYIPNLPPPPHTHTHTYAGQALLCQPLRCLQLIPSLLHSSLKLCSTLLVANHKPTPHDLLVIGGLFPLITNCALSNEGRAMLRKVR